MRSCDSCTRFRVSKMSCRATINRMRAKYKITRVTVVTCARVSRCVNSQVTREYWLVHSQVTREYCMSCSLASYSRVYCMSCSLASYSRVLAYSLASYSRVLACSLASYLLACSLASYSRITTLTLASCLCPHATHV